MTERWLEIAGIDGYEVSDAGRVRSLPRIVECKDGVSRRFGGKILRQNKSGSGYYQVVLSDRGTQTNTSVHRIVAAAFIGEIGPGIDVCHNDGNRENNRADNLRLDDHTGNMADCVAHGTSPAGARNARSVLRDGDVISLRIAHASGSSRADLARRFNISTAQVGLIVTGRAWGHLGGPISPPSPVRGEGSSGSKLTDDDVRNIRRKYAAGGVTMAELSKGYGISRPAISLIISRKNWAHVQDD